MCAIQTVAEIIDKINMTLIAQYDRIMTMQDQLDNSKDTALQENLNDIEDSVYDLSCDVSHLRRLIV